MATIICKKCGYENEEGSEICEICAEFLTENPTVENEFSETENTPVSATNTDGKEYFVMCPESQTRTVIPDGNATTFFCEGCQREHDIDGFLWQVECKDAEENCTETTAPTTPKGDNLWLEEVRTNYRIDISKEGGSLGRYGKFGYSFFQRNNMVTISGDHCFFSYEFGNWVIRHTGRNSTVYDNMLLERNEPYLLEDGKLLVLANTVTFIVRIG